MSDFFRNFLTERKSAVSRTAPIAFVPAYLTSGALALAAAFVLSGCGSNLRPTVTPIVGTGPAAQPASNAFVISTPSATTQGVGTVVDYAGDTIMATAPIGPGPTMFTLNGAGSTA